MIKSIRYRLYPTESQKVLINKHIGACRFVYNLALETRLTIYASTKKNISGFELIKQLPELKKECSWLKEVCACSLQQSIIHLDKAFTKFFKGNAGFPNFKKNIGKQCFHNPKGIAVKIKDGRIHVPKFTEGIKFVQDRVFNGEVRKSIISKVPTGKYYITLIIDEENTDLTCPKQGVIGVDLGINHYIVTSDGDKTDNPKYLIDSIERIKVLQRRLRRKKDGSLNKNKEYLKIKLLHEKVTNQRKDFLHKLSTKLIRENQTICIEDLDIGRMVKNHRLALSISDAGWGSFVSMLKYKALWYGSTILEIPTFQPSTKLCSECGRMNHSLTLSDRTWICDCGVTHDRDINAAINIKNYCLNNSGKGIPNVPVELPTLVGVMKQEDN